MRIKDFLQPDNGEAFEVINTQIYVSKQTASRHAELRELVAHMGRIKGSCRRN